MTLQLVSTIRPYVYNKNQADDVIPDRLDWEYDYSKEESE